MGGRPEDLGVSKKCPSVGRIWSIPKAKSELKGWVKSWRFKVLGCSPGNGWGGAWGGSICMQRLSPRTLWGFRGCRGPGLVSGILGTGLMSW